VGGCSRARDLGAGADEGGEALEGAMRRGEKGGWGVGLQAGGSLLEGVCACVSL
jgi:hypothetical protein